MGGPTRVASTTGDHHANAPGSIQRPQRGTNEQEDHTMNPWAWWTQLRERRWLKGLAKAGKGYAVKVWALSPPGPPAILAMRRPSS